jgi:outer membrane protein TolC
MIRNRMSFCIKKIKNLKISIFVIFLLIWTLPINAQFESLVNKAWSNSKQLQSHNFSLEQAQLEIKEANAMRGPMISGNFQYSLATGGRAIEFPIGDLLNPAYTALNKLTNSNDFPTFENQKINFLPFNFYDAKVRIIQPISVPDIAIGKEIKQYQYNIKEQEIMAYKRMLSKEVINTSIQITMATEALIVFQENRKLLEEAKRTTNSMLKNGIALPSAIHRIDAELSSLTEQEIMTINNKENAERYLFFLTKDSIDPTITTYLNQLPSTEGLKGAKREELTQLDEAGKIYQTLIKKEGLFYKPKIGAQLDLGSQAFNFGVSPYALLGLNLDLNIFDNKRHKIRSDFAKASLSEHTSKKEHVSDQLNLQSEISLQNLTSAIAQCGTYPQRITSATKAYNEVFTKYKEGVSNYFELFDAQTRLINVKIQSNLAKYNAWLKWSDHLYNTAGFIIK